QRRGGGVAGIQYVHRPGPGVDHENALVHRVEGRNLRRADLIGAGGIAAQQAQLDILRCSSGGRYNAVAAAPAAVTKTTAQTGRNRQGGCTRHPSFRQGLPLIEMGAYLIALAGCGVVTWLLRIVAGWKMLRGYCGFAISARAVTAELSK